MIPNANAPAKTTPTNAISTHGEVLPKAGRCRPTESQPRLSLFLIMNNTKAAQANKAISRARTF